MEANASLFQNGATWLRADFHLRTKADKEFKYDGEENAFVAAYVEALNEAGIKIGVVANHNKFAADEFKALKKAARKQEIFLLPGVELSVNDGANGIHASIVFADRWLTDGNDYISPLITSMFPGKAPSEYQHENARSDRTILQVVEELDQTGRDYFLIFAHVEQRNGLWFEMSGGKLGDFVTPGYDAVRERTLGFQTVRTRTERDKVKQWLGNWYPAELEGSDAKRIEDIGNGERCYLKLGAFSFDAVKHALIDHADRTTADLPAYRHSHIKKVVFEGGTLAGRTIYFSPELNTLIGIRGSGKSSILEVLRYVLDIPFGDKAGDQKYKQELLGFTLGSGGKAMLHAVDRYGQSYEIRRVWQENFSHVYIDNKLQPGVSIRETVLHKPIYFGQKDLANTGEGFATDLVEKLLGSRLYEIRRKIAEQKNKVTELIDRLTKIANVEEQIQAQTAIKLDTEHRLEAYKAHGLEEKLQKRLDFDADIRAMKKGVELVAAFSVDIKALLAQHEDALRNFSGYESKRNAGAFQQFETIYSQAIQSLDTIEAESRKSATTQAELSSKYAELVSKRQALIDEFAETERKLAEELQTTASRNISADEFLRLKQRLDHATQLLAALSRQDNQKAGIASLLAQESRRLNDLWREEFLIIKAELDKVGGGNSALAISLGYKEDKSAFLNFMKNVFKGSGIRESIFQGIVDQYADFVAIYADFDNAKKLFGGNPQLMADLFMKNLQALMTYQTPNKFTIAYRGKELERHSLGQRASALILFVLSQRENDVIIIDQPEDDLDNQTIYEDVIKLVRDMKPNTQFIFATHNPNIPVLGDAEQIHACAFMDNAIAVQSGGIDDPHQQKTIVDIMEGGIEAFNRRKEIYRTWKS